MEADRGLLDRFARHRSRSDTFCHFWIGETEQPISFRELFGHAARYSAAYRAAGLPAGGLVILATEFSPEGMYAFIGALIGGLVPAFVAPLTDKQSPEQFVTTLEAIVGYTRPAALVVTPGQVQDFVPKGVPVLLAEAGPMPGDDSPWLLPDPAAPAFMQFSSGTTGLRKGVVLSHRVVAAQIAAFEATVRLAQGDLIASWLPLYHDMGLVACFIIPLALGIPIALQDPITWSREPARLFAAIERHGATHCWLPNFAFNHLRLTVPKAPRFDLSTMKVFVNCSEPCKPATFDAFCARFADWGLDDAKLANSYAMAEAVFAVTQTPVGEPAFRLRCSPEDLASDRRLVPAEGGVELMSTGRLLPGLRLAVLDADGQPLQDGRIGQIALAGDSIFEAYYRNADATRTALRDGWFLTGDLGALWQGEVFITGREKDVIIVNGRNFYAHDVESIVSTVEGVKAGRAVAFAIDNPMIGSEEVVVVAETEQDPTAYRRLAGEIKRRVSEELGLTAVRAHPVPLRWLAKTTSGKISRRDNCEKYLATRKQAAGSGSRT